MRVLGVNAVFHDPAAALVVDGRVVAAAEEERFSRRKHGKDPVPFAAWELPAQSARWCLSAGGIGAADLDRVAYSYDPRLVAPGDDDITAADWEPLRTLYARRAPLFLRSLLPDLDPGRVEFVPHHIAHAASAYLTAPFRSCAVLVLDGRGESASHLAGHVRDGELEVLASQALPHSLGLVYEELTEHLGFRRASDEYKVMALASYGRPVLLDLMRERIQVDGLSFTVDPIEWDDHAGLAPADLAASLQHRLEEVLLALGEDLHQRTGERRLAMAGGVALNCVANARLAREGPFDDIWVQPAAGDAGTALGAALYTAHSMGDHIESPASHALGREWDEADIARQLHEARIVHERPPDIAAAAAEVLADGGVVAWFQGRSEFGPRALGHRSLLADPSERGTLERLNDIKGREQFRPVAPMVPLDRAAEIFDGPLPSPNMLFVHRVRAEWRLRIPAAVHVDDTARVQTVDASEEPLLGRLLERFAQRTGVPVLINTSLNTAGRPMVDSPRDALECFGSAPIDALALGPFLVRRRR